MKRSSDVHFAGEPVTGPDGEPLYAVVHTAPGKAIAVDAGRAQLEAGTYDLIDRAGSVQGRCFVLEFDNRG